MRRRVISVIFQTTRNITMKWTMSKLLAPTYTVFFTAFTMVPAFQRATLAGVFPMWLLVHASATDEKRREAVQSNKELIEKADALYEEMKYEDIYNLLCSDDLLNDDDILWRLARVTYELSMTSSKERAKSLGEEAFKYVRKALEINDDNFNAHRWYAILLDHVATANGTKERLIKSSECREHMEKATRICNTDATSYYMIGVWCYTFADLPWYVRKMAAVIFASPPESSFEEALSYFEKAEEVRPDFYSRNLLMLGKTYLKLNDKEKGIYFLQRTKNYPLKTREDHEAFKEACDLLKSLKVK